VRPFGNEKMNSLIRLLRSASQPSNGGPRCCMVGLTICFHLDGILLYTRCIYTWCKV